MCGICGKYVFERNGVVESSTISAMLQTLTHRGPDGQGIYLASQIGLGHRRLSIIDIKNGGQPMSNEDGSVWITFNGEIYNHRELRNLLQTRGHRFRTMSDTEVIIHLFEEVGESCVNMLRGMFAFAIWNESNRMLYLARDRVGIKPLYYALDQNSLVFASELKALLAARTSTACLSPEVIDRFLAFHYVPGNRTLLTNIFKLPPASYMMIDCGKVRVNKYWDLSFERRQISPCDAQAELIELMKEAVRLHMISDVPVGFLLSGGIDSSAILSFAAEDTGHTLESYTVGFSAPTVVDERPYSRRVASECGSRHHEMTISPQDFRDFLPTYAWHMEEPVCEPPAVSLYYISRLAGRQVNVLMSGEGADEAFAGYDNYRDLLWIERAKRLPGCLHSTMARLLTTANEAFIGSEAIRKVAPLLNRSMRSYYYSRSSNPTRYFNSEYRSLYSDYLLRRTDKKWSVSVATDHLSTWDAGKRPLRDPLSAMLYVDTMTWLPDDLLLKADKMTMANSVELRVPFLDHKLLEFAASLPSSYKVKGFSTKFILRQALKGRLPDTIIRRPKAGFPVPYAAWLRTDLKDWLWGLLLDRKTSQRGYFRRAAIERLLLDDLQTKRYGKELFSLAMLELWHRAFLP